MGGMIKLQRKRLRDTTGVHLDEPTAEISCIPHAMLHRIDAMFSANLAPGQVWRTLMLSANRDWKQLAAVPSMALLRYLAQKDTALRQTLSVMRLTL